VRGVADVDVSICGMTIRRGGQTLVRDVNLELHSGEMVGLIGPNGAGKSTTLSGLLGIAPAEGVLVVDGREWDLGHQEVPYEVRRKIAYIPEQPLYYADMTLAEHVEWKRRLWQLGGLDHDAAIRARAQELVDRLALAQHMHKYPHECSKGTLQKLMVLLAVLFPFDVLVVDEPFIGLDVVAIHEVRTLLAAARDAGAAVLLSTHVLDWAERLCNRFVLMVNGEILAQGTLAELRSACGLPDASLEDVFMQIYRDRRVGQ
jgi:ABC-2 type transport system ATP-binding protein